MNRLQVTGRAQEQRVRTERKRVDGGVSLDTSPELEQPLALGHREHTYDRALLRGRGQLGTVPVEGDGRQRAVMSRDHGDRAQIDCVEYLHLAHLATARISQIALFVVDGQRAQAFRIRGYVSNRVDYSHVADIVNINALFEANYESLLNFRWIEKS